MQPEKRSEKPLICSVLTTFCRSDDPELWELALDSILVQAEPGLEVRIHLCVDGALPPAHEAALERRQPQIHMILRNPENLGLAGSLNRLIEELGEADYVLRMDADDISLPGRFRTQIDWLETHPDLALVGCQVTDIDEEGRAIGQRNYPVDASAAKKLLTRQNPVSHATFCMRRSLLRDPAVRYPRAYLTEDLAFLVILAEQGYAFGNIPERLFQWRLGAGFFRRRSSWKRGITELLWFGRAVLAVKGLWTRDWVYPVARLVLRCLPAGLMKRVYRTNLRERAVQHA